ncbi:MAG: tetratricopeptide repeat protein [Gammaproteobacteria bacterium]
MSIINNVLKDLEARPSRFVPIEIASVETAVRGQVKSTKTQTILLVLVLLTGALAYWFFQIHQDSDAFVSQAEAIVDTPTTPVPLAAAIEPVTPVNQIIDLQISESAENMSLEFSLQTKVISYLKERGENSFVYFLKDIRSEIVAPVINNNRWIEQLSISTLDGGIEVSFHTAPGVLVETRQQPGGDTQIWAIKLKKPPAPIVVTKDAETPIKTVVEPPSVKPLPAITVDTNVDPKIEVEAAEQPKAVKLDIKSSTPELTDNEKLQKAIDLQKRRRWQQAETVLKSLIDGTEDLGARQNLLSLYEYRQQAGNYSRLLQESIDLYPQQPIFKTRFARSLYKTGDYAVVIEYLQNTDNADAIQLALIAASYQRLDQHAKAIEYYRQSLDKENRDAKNWIGLGISQEHTAQLKDALRSYRIAARLGNTSARLQAFVEKRIGQLVKAIN